MKRIGWALAVASTLVLAACGYSQQSGAVVPPGDASRAALTLRPIPVYSPTPAPNPGLIGGLVSLLSNVACGVTSGITCHLIPGAGPQGLKAGTPASALPGLIPSDLQTIYALPASTAGKGQTIGIAVAFDNPKLEADLAVYRSTFGLPACTTQNGCFKKIAPFLGGLLSGNQGWGQESSIDVQIASAVCPNCKIVVVEAGTDTASALLAAAKTAVANGATVVSASYSLDESASEKDADYAIGVPYVVGAGDWGAGAQWPAASSHVIAVGGTSVARDVSSRGFRDSVWIGTGGGCSAYIAKPAWQHDAGCAHRTANDIAAFADPNPGVAVYDSYLDRSPGWRTYGGTSVSAPIVAGAIALAGNGKSMLLDASYIYAHAASLNPVTTGLNGVCGTYLCNAANGYSAPAGNGALNGIGAL